MTDVINDVCLYCSTLVSGVEKVCDNCYYSLIACECCYNLFMSCLTVEYGLLSTKRCVTCLSNSYYACVCCGVFYMDTNTDKYKKCLRCDETFNNILSEKTPPKMVNNNFSIHVWYECNHWRSGYVFKTENIHRRYTEDTFYERQSYKYISIRCFRM